MTGPKSRAYAAVLKAYADTTGVSVRTAQRHAKQAHPDWKRFSQSTMIAAVNRPPSESMSEVEVEVISSASPLAPPELPESVRRDESELAEPERMLRAAWSLWSEHFRMWRGCLGGKDPKTKEDLPRDPTMACVQANMLMKLRADYDKALAKHTQWQIDNRRLIPANEFHAFRSAFLIPLRNLLANMPAEAAPLVNPRDQQQAIKGGTEYLQGRLFPQIQQCLDALDVLTPSLRAA